MSKLTLLIEDFGKALSRLEEVLAKENDAENIVRDSAIQRFEIVFDLGWKTAKAFLEEHHTITCTSPRSCFRELFHQGVIEHDPFWIEVTSLRNYTTHTYSELLAQKVYAELPQTLKRFRELHEKLRADKSGLE
ncbi:MAG: nucleotidyltransferase [Candidatus Vogelbacteria bacterium CG10_big_fil_rev_8_21_14_0_10_51_16]|uniref:Nucleotidyltransferase n=1 Tax=Candidatus Vogelbacteria bacterium CG10_big_fil_rev_8_21_14_0_10_51_16 TaxID=1975045 RepID=A0A2H0REM5_9BACT|nr:MAG: nucleotidyltransferase [Candidatus Vogelbacteria bacterium CG10_big_fil_rev_8_21_14_0_10_51_16]